MSENNDLKQPTLAPNLIYIMGTARSGTTILEILLANSKNVFGGGEITAFFEDGMIKNLPCSCGQLTADCGVWSKTIKMLKSQGFSAESTMVLNRKFDWHWGFLRSLFSVDRSAERREYELTNWSVVDQLADDNNALMIIDSSKYAARALNLHKLKPENVWVICMTRDVSGLLKSFRKKNIGEQGRRSLFSAVVYIVIVSMCLSFTRWRLGQKCLKGHGKVVKLLQ